MDDRQEGQPEGVGDDDRVGIYERMREPCRDCGWDLGRRVAQRHANGAYGIRHQCAQCGRLSAYFTHRRDYEPWSLPLVDDYVGSSPPCERCRDPRSEWHHWAPQSIFDDSEEWPGSWLCPVCHAEWHQRTGIALGTTSIF